LRKIIIYVFLWIFYSCTPTYRITSKTKHEIAKDNYTVVDTILLSNYIFCMNYADRNLWKDKIKMQPMENDSIFEMFDKALQKLNLNVVVEKNINHCDTVLDFIFPLKVEKIDTNRIKSIASHINKKNILILFPIIHSNNITQKAMMVTSKGIPDGGYFMRDTFLNIAIYLIKDDEIIYLKSARYGSVSSETASPDEEPPKKLEQQHWDKLVELVMRDYIKRMK
jgi:hypothetical protein